MHTLIIVTLEALWSQLKSSETHKGRWWLRLAPESKIDPLFMTILKFGVRKTMIDTRRMYDDTGKSIGQALVSSRIDYATGILYGISKSQKDHASSCVVLWVASDLLLVAKLDWLPIKYRIRFQLETLTFKTFHYGQLSNLSALLMRCSCTST